MSSRLSSPKFNFALLTASKGAAECLEKNAGYASKSQALAEKLFFLKKGSL